MRNFDEAGKYSSTITPVDGKPTSSSLVGNLKSDETDNSNATASCHEEKEVPRSIQKTCNGKVGKESSDYATNESPKNKSKIFDRVCEIEEKGKREEQQDNLNDATTVTFNNKKKDKSNAHTCYYSDNKEATTIQETESSEFREDFSDDNDEQPRKIQEGESSEVPKKIIEFATSNAGYDGK